MIRSYALITKGANEWVFASQNYQETDKHLLNLLNTAGAKGWRVVAVGDFGGDIHHEIILEHD